VKLLWATFGCNDVLQTQASYLLQYDDIRAVRYCVDLHGFDDAIEQRRGADTGNVNAEDEGEEGGNRVDHLIPPPRRFLWIISPLYGFDPPLGGGERKQWCTLDSYNIDTPVWSSFAFLQPKVAHKF